MARRTAAETQQEPPIVAHPLFPLDDEPESDALPAQVTTIHVRRLEGGDWKTVPAAFAPDQLTSWEQIWTAWGGGKYELIARDDHGRITARVTEVMPGASRSLVPDQPAEPQAHQAPAQAPPALGLDLGGPMALMLQMMAGQQSAQQQMFLAFLERSDRAAQQQQQTMATMYGQSSQLMANIFGKMAEQKEAGRPEEVFIRGIETANALRAGAAQEQGGGGGGGGDLASIAETVRVVGQSIAAAQQAPTAAAQIAAGAEAVAAAGKAVGQ